MSMHKAFTIISAKRQGFTLIESLAVVSIIGILATITFYGISGYQKAARDTKRKSDVYALSQGFEARALDQTCSSPSDIGKYPDVAGSTSATVKWLSVNGDGGLKSDVSCNGFSSYLTTIPTDPQLGYDYFFNLNSLTAAYAAKTHYRIAASLEKNNVNSCAGDTVESNRWATVYGGVAYDCPTFNGSIHSQFSQDQNSRRYDYYVGK